MAYKTILVCLNDVSRLTELISAAEQLGTRFKAHIAGLYVIPAVQVYPNSSFGVEGAVFDGTRIYFQEQKPKVAEAFEQAMKRAGLSYDLHVADSRLSDIQGEVIANAREVDLVVVSNTARNGSQGIEDDFVERFVVAAGRPVLVLPAEGKVDLRAEQVLVGWNESREATRAVFDAMPFLIKAKQARLVSVDVPPGGNMPASGLAETLDRHGAKPEITSVASDGLNVGDALLRAAKDYGAGLVVVGAYGHSRFAEWVFGGATRHILQNMKVPVLMSH
jgi:nucleotide-binding universal stress UspA family protein